jgi:hypothetical protein
MQRRDVIKIIAYSGKLSRIMAVVGPLGVLAPQLAGTPAFAQGGSTGGTLGNVNKSVSGGGAAAAPEPRARSHAAPTRRASVEPRSQASSGAADGAWTVSATPTCLPAWTLAVSVNNGVISGSGASGQVSRAGGVSGNVTVLGFSFDFVGHIRGGRQASGTLTGANGCRGQWTAAKT